MSAIVIYTDSETRAGGIHPAQALRQRRNEFVGDAKAVVVGMTSNGCTLADPNARGMLDVAGFDTSVPAVIAAFAREYRTVQDAKRQAMWAEAKVAAGTFNSSPVGRAVSSPDDCDVRNPASNCL